YCLFLTARYKEALDHGGGTCDAVGDAISGVGAALVASAATVMFGIGMMWFAQFGKFKEAGVAIPLSLLLVLAATLTFSPALLCLTGRWAFWPWRPEYISVGGSAPAEDEHTGICKAGTLTRLWDHVGHWLVRRPGLIWLGTVACMAPFVVVAA